MIILGIETSCDETAAAILQKSGDRVTILSNVISSSASLQAKYGGIIPEQAAREQIKSIIPVIEAALTQAFPDVIPANAGIQLNKSCSELDPRLRGDDRVRKIDAIAVTYGPGLIGSLLVGVETAKVLAAVWQKPLIPINHLLGHFYANWIETTPPTFPCLGLLVSGGHTDLILFLDHGKYKYLGGTRDDAAGECFDKCARLLGLPYPGGPAIAKLASQGETSRFKLPIPMKASKDLDFSYSGLKTAVANIVTSLPVIPSEARNLKIYESRDPSLIVQDDNTIADLAAAIQEAIIKSLIDKVIKATQTYKIEQIMIAGGVAANQKLKDDLRLKINDLRMNIQLHVPPPYLCTDNAAMIAAAGFFAKKITTLFSLQANPNISLAN